MNDTNELVNDIITFFQKFGASNELSNRNFDTSDFFSEEYCNYVLDLGKKYGLYDEIKEAKDINYIMNLEDEMANYFKKILLERFNV
ncbi:MAG: hypothetical protein E7Z84_08885 [Methanosphaera stadtmanae]|nr:hypothetical protein [Methanosphaera stadtmanae]